MRKGPKRSARVAIVICITMFTGGALAFGAQGRVAPPHLIRQTESPSPSPTPSPTPTCIGGISPPTPAPAPICNTPPPEPTPEPTPEASPTPDPEPAEPPNEADPPKKGSSVAFGYDKKQGAFFGTINSVNKCLGQRTVSIHKVKSGADNLVSSTTTDDKGGFSIKRAKPRGTFYAVVLKSIAGTYGKLIICTPARSKTLRVQR